MIFNVAQEKFLLLIIATRSDGTYRYLKSKCDSLNLYFGEMDIKELDENDLLSFVGFLRKRNDKVSNTTINKYISVFNRILKYNKEKVIDFPKLPETKKIIPMVSKTSQYKIFRYLYSRINFRASLRNLVLFKLLLDTGLRINEALNIVIKNIDFETNTIIIDVTKTKNDRFVFFTNDTKVLLLKLIEEHKLKKYLFINYDTKTRLTVNNVESICYRLQRRLNLDQNVRPHRWRHTFATNFLKKGGDLEALRLILGHSSIKTTQRYLHLDKSYLHKVYFSINE